MKWWRIGCMDCWGGRAEAGDGEVIWSRPQRQFIWAAFWLSLERHWGCQWPSGVGKEALCSLGLFCLFTVSRWLRIQTGRGWEESKEAAKNKHKYMTQNTELNHLYLTAKQTWQSESQTCGTCLVNPQRDQSNHHSLPEEHDAASA